MIFYLANKQRRSGTLYCSYYHHHHHHHEILVATTCIIISIIVAYLSSTNIPYDDDTTFVHAFSISSKQLLHPKTKQYFQSRRLLSSLSSSSSSGSFNTISFPTCYRKCNECRATVTMTKMMTLDSNEDNIIDDTTTASVTTDTTFIQIPSTSTTPDTNDTITSMSTSTTTKVMNGNVSIDEILSKLTLAFPFFVVLCAIIGVTYPQTLLWVNSYNIVTYLLALVMFGTGLTLQKQDFVTIWDIPSNRYSVPLGVLCQFIIMPSTAYVVGKFFFLSELFLPSIGKVSKDILSALFIGLCFVGCSPGGTASNVVTYIANANVALSVVLTSCSTFAAVIVTPLLIKLLLRNTIYTTGSNAVSAATTSSAASSSLIHISGWSLCTSTAKVVLAPIMMGMVFKKYLPQLTKTLCRFTPILSVFAVSLICGGVVAQQTAALTSTITGSTSASIIGTYFPILMLSVLSLHAIGFIMGYIIPKVLLPKDMSDNERTARTISIEVGMQNSALAVVLARSIPNLHPMACLPGAISATVHSCLGSILAAIWRWQSINKKE